MEEKATWQLHVLKMANGKQQWSTGSTCTRCLERVAAAKRESGGKGGFSAMLCCIWQQQHHDRAVLVFGCKQQSTGGTTGSKVECMVKIITMMTNNHQWYGQQCTSPSRMEAQHTIPNIHRSQCPSTIFLLFVPYQNSNILFRPFQYSMTVWSPEKRHVHKGLSQSAQWQLYAKNQSMTAAPLASPTPAIILPKWLTLDDSKASPASFSNSWFTLKVTINWWQWQQCHPAVAGISASSDKNSKW